MGVPAHAVTDAAEAVGAGRPQRLQHRAHVGSQVQVGVSDDAVGGAGVAVHPAGGLGRDALYKLHLADGAHGVIRFGPVHGAGLHEHSGHDVVPAARVGQQLIQHVSRLHAVGAPVPQVMVGIADG